MPEESKRTALLVFLFSIFIFLGIFIFVYSYNLTKGSANYSQTTSKTSIECVGYSFRIVGDSISYNNSELSFIVEPSGGGALNKLVVNADGQRFETKNVDFSASYRQNIKLKIPFAESFELSPIGCPDNIKRCSMSTKQCEVA